MISHLRIQDFAIVENVDIDFDGGLNIITGETGAGKSIIIEAISLALGSRADSTYVRTGKSKAIIQLIASTEDEEYIITREISAGGKSICRVNDTIVSLGYLSGLCKKIADIHGQYDHQSLLNPDNHIHLLDLYDCKTIAPAKEDVKILYEKYSDAKRKLENLLKNVTDSLRKQDFMKFELEEINNANLIPGEDEELEQKLLMLQNGEKIFQNSSSAYDMLYGDTPSAVEAIKKSLGLLEEISDYSKDIEGLKDTISDCYYKLEDASSDLRKMRDNISFSPEELDDAIGRMDLLFTLKKKYGNTSNGHKLSNTEGTLEGVFAYRDVIKKELLKIENADDLKATLTSDLSDLEDRLLKASLKLSNLRQISAKALEEKVNIELTQLNFSNSVLTVKLEESNTDLPSLFSAEGIDKAEFLIITNKGQTPKPLAKIASGGEISRIMLAFKRIIGDYDRIPTMIFDEIDSGISGITAAVVGKKLQEISENHQIICITHLPQIAAFGDHHYKIQKFTDETSTHTTVIPLSYEEKVAEIARLLGGINVTDTTLKSADELIHLSKK